MLYLKLFEEFNSKEEYPKIISRERLLEIHDDLIERYGGIYGIRSEHQLDSALSRPYMSAFGQDIYPDDISKIAAFMQAIIKTHPLADANKRTGFHCMLELVKEKGFEFKLSYDEARPFLAEIASRSNISAEDVKEWIEQNIR